MNESEHDSDFEILQRPIEELQTQIELELEGNDKVEWEVLRNCLLGIINEEDKTKPLTDKELAEQLHANDVNVSPHVVRKYRQALRIPDPDKRREDF